MVNSMSIFKKGNVVEYDQDGKQFRVRITSDEFEGNFQGEVIQVLKGDAWEVGHVSNRWAASEDYFKLVERKVPNLFHLVSLCEREASLLAEYEAVKSERQALELELDTWLEEIKHG